MASLHFNENLLREPQKTKDGKDYLLVTYPKYKVGEEVVREIKVPPTYSKHVLFFTLATAVDPNQDLWKGNGCYEGYISKHFRGRVG